MKGLQIPERFTGKVYVCVWSNPDSCLYGNLYISDCYFEGSKDSIMLGSVDVDIPLNRTGSLEKQVEQLRASKRKIIDEASAKAGQIDEAIESLLAIEYKGDNS